MTPPSVAALLRNVMLPCAVLWVAAATDEPSCDANGGNQGSPPPVFSVSALGQEALARASDLCDLEDRLSARIPAQGFHPMCVFPIASTGADGVDVGVVGFRDGLRPHGSDADGAPGAVLRPTLRLALRVGLGAADRRAADRGRSAAATVTRALRLALQTELDLPTANRMGLWTPEGRRVLVVPPEALGLHSRIGRSDPEKRSGASADPDRDAAHELWVFSGGAFQWPGVRVGLVRAVDLGGGRTAEAETLSLSPVVLRVRGFLDPDECDAVIAAAEPTIARSTVATIDADLERAADAAEVRTSSHMFLPRGGGLPEAGRGRVAGTPPASGGAPKRKRRRRKRAAAAARRPGTETRNRTPKPQTVVRALEDRAHALTRTTRVQGEALQVVRYRGAPNSQIPDEEIRNAPSAAEGKKRRAKRRRHVPEMYEAHWDYFDPASYARQPAMLRMLQHGHRNRLATVFWYMTDVPPGRGGETFFPRALDAGTGRLLTPWEWDYRNCDVGLKVSPERGTALLFYSLRPDGTLDPNSLHGGCPVGPPAPQADAVDGGAVDGGAVDGGAVGGGAVGGGAPRRLTKWAGNAWIWSGAASSASFRMPARPDLAVAAPPPGFVRFPQPSTKSYVDYDEDGGRVRWGEPGAYASLWADDEW